MNLKCCMYKESRLLISIFRWLMALIYLCKIFLFIWAPVLFLLPALINAREKYWLLKA